ncbi:prolyl oligopeptidase family serine peptidase [Polaribacter sp. Q13]|uniref:prolyl oligopeptidase family serine peptidase n=1 Tax=Polaribacter sp. Q13 TaxID=2806551 RepID=UPI00193BA92F|nr:prolyl oligopeptidase family serine peptidase [Polaribacter sp. Q13]QVY64616.1 prolyl oligopeptidase family serine peptidase [Polaribacter sp. Q13]
MDKKLVLPKYPINKTFDTIFGERVVDPYKYIENLEDTVALNWYKKQTVFSNQIISKITNRDEIIELQNKLQIGSSTNISNLEITSNDKYFYLKSNAVNSNKRLFYRNGFNNKEILLFDPKQIDNTNIINYIKPSWDGSKIVIGITKNDIEIGDLVVLNVVNKKVIESKIKNCWPSALGGIRWLPNNSGFTYEFIPEIDKKSKKYLHNIETMLHVLVGNSFKDKILLSKSNNPELGMEEQDFPEVNFKSNISKYMFASVSGASYYADYYYSNLNSILKSKIEWKKLYNKEDLVKRFYIDGNDIIFLTAKNAKNFKICKTSLLNPNFTEAELLVKEDTTAVITDFTLTKNGIFFVKTKNGVNAKLYQLNSKKEISKIKTPKKAGYINVSSKGSSYDNLWIEVRGWASQKEQYQFDYIKNKFVNHKLYSNAFYKGLLSDLIIEEVEVLSHDNVKVPLSIIYKKGTKLDGNNSVLLRGYGAFGVSMKPAVSNYLVHWINNGGIYAVSHVRGGGEKGNAWYKAGYKKTKPNSWKDFIASAEYLIDNKYTSAKKIVANSASGGGILVGNAIAERPDLFGVAVVTVGIFNTIRSEFAPNGKNLSREFGTVSDSLEFKYLLKMDAYNKIKKGINYPAVYLTAGLNDSRVAVWQPAKFAAKLQESTASNKPILLSVNFNGGHGFDATKETRNEELANILSFAFWQTGHPDFKLK